MNLAPLKAPPPTPLISIVYAVVSVVLFYVAKILLPEKALNAAVKS